MIVQFFMCLHRHNIITIQQPVQLLAGQANHPIQHLARPLELRLFQALLPQAITITLPVKDLYLIALAVAEHKQVFRKRISFQLSLYQYCQRIDAFSKINNIPTQLYHR